MSLSPGKIGKLFFFGVIPLAVAITFVVSGYKYVPVGLNVGKCMMDYTSPLSYTDRSSPMKEHRFRVGGGDIVMCYGSPSVKDRKVFGELVPYDQLWRLGANEPTRLYTNNDLVIGEVVVPKGRYSLYVIPNRGRWEIYISESITHWGNDINYKVRAQEIGSFEVKTEYVREPIEELTITSQGNRMIIQWEHTQVTIPIENIES
jgi:hypothetical protein